MILNVGDYVKVFFKNGINAEGFVEHWTDFNSVLRSDNDDILIIQNVKEDVMLIKVFPNKSSKDKNKNIYLQEINQKIEDIKTEPIDNLKLKDLSDLRKMQAIQEKKIISEKLKSHHLSEIKEVKYDVPRFFKK